MSNPNNPNFSYDIYGGIDEAVDEARAQNAASDLKLPGLVEAAHAVSAKPADMAELWHDANIDPYFLAVAEDSLRASAEIGRFIGLSMPELRSFMEAGVDFERLSRAYTIMDDLQLQPKLVFAPVLSVNDWSQLYIHQRDDPRTDHHVIQNKGLVIWHDLHNKWESGSATTRHTMTIEDAQYQVLVLTGTVRPPIRDVDRDGLDRDNLQNIRLHHILQDLVSVNKPDSSMSFHPSTHAYLALQATLLQQGKPPIDIADSTWLDGWVDRNEHRGSIHGAYEVRDSKVMLNWAFNSSISENMGVRPTIWG